MIEKKRIGLFTSGGDAPGMNAAIRAVVRTAIHYDLEVVGIMRGYEGMIDNEMQLLDSNSVSGIINRGGTILKTARSERFRTDEGMAKAFQNLQSQNISGLIAIGGDGTFRGANAFLEKHSIPTIGIPGTIDNDLYGTDFTIGYDTAINTAMEAIDKIRDTADAHNRLFFIEVMGRDAGFIAMRSGIAGGAEAILVPESKTDLDAVIDLLQRGWNRKKTSNIVVVAEGDEAGGAFKVAEAVKGKLQQFDTRVSIIGHTQRGGAPTCMDRVLASRLGVAAVEALLNGKQNVMVGVLHRDISYTPFNQATKHNLDVNLNLLRIAEILSS